jgi:hypothetical protein
MAVKRATLSVFLLALLLPVAGLVFFLHRGSRSGGGGDFKTVQIINFNFVGTREDAGLLVMRVPDWAEARMDEPRHLRRFVPGSSGGQPHLRTRNGAEMLIYMGRLPPDSGPSGQKKPVEEQQFGRWRGSLQTEKGMGIESKRFHLWADEEYAFGFVIWTEDDAAARAEADELFHAVLDSIRLQPVPVSTGK